MDFGRLFQLGNNRQPQGGTQPNGGQPGGTPGTAPGGAPAGNPGNQPGSSMQLGGGNFGPGAGNNGGTGGQPGGAGGGGDSRLDPFKDLWKDDPNKQGQNGGDPFSNPLFSMDPAKVAEAANGMDFISSVPQELMQKAMGGDFQSMMQVMQHVARQSLTTALQVSTAMQEQAGSKLGGRFKDAFGQQFKEWQLNSQRPSNPTLEHPAVKEMLKLVRQRFASMNPDMPADEVQRQAEQYMMQFAGSLLENDPTTRQRQQQQIPQETNWASWGNS